MSLNLAVAEVPCIDARYEGRINIEARLGAKELIASSAEKAGVRQALIDLSDATVQPYSVNDALRVTRKVASLAALHRMAYVLPRGRADMVASVLSTTHGPGFVSIFNDRQSALSWLAAAA